MPGSFFSFLHFLLSFFVFFGDGVSLCSQVGLELPMQPWLAWNLQPACPIPQFLSQPLIFRPICCEGLPAGDSGWGKEIQGRGWAGEGGLGS